MLIVGRHRAGARTTLSWAPEPWSPLTYRGVPVASLRWRLSSRSARRACLARRFSSTDLPFFRVFPSLMIHLLANRKKRGSEERPTKERVITTEGARNASNGGGDGARVEALPRRRSSQERSGCSVSTARAPAGSKGAVQASGGAPRRSAHQEAGRSAAGTVLPRIPNVTKVSMSTP